LPEIRTPTEVKWNGPTVIFGGVAGMNAMNEELS
jgi:hypothetical protein